MTCARLYTSETRKRFAHVSRCFRFNTMPLHDMANVSVFKSVIMHTYAMRVRLSNFVSITDSVPSNIIYDKKSMFAIFYNCIYTWFGWFAFARMKKASTTSARLCSSALAWWEIRQTSLRNTWCKKWKVFHEGKQTSRLQTIDDVVPSASTRFDCDYVNALKYIYIYFAWDKPTKFGNRFQH